VFDFVVNRDTATILGLTLPQSLMAQAEVIVSS